MSSVTRKYQFAFVPGSNWWAVEERPALDFCCFAVLVILSKMFREVSYGEDFNRLTL